MDREIPKKEQRRARIWRMMKVATGAVLLIAVVFFISNMLRSSVNARDLTFSTVDKGTVEVSVSANGTVVPAFEEIINSPINTRIVEVYRRAGDSVDVGTPLLKLDLQSAETDYKKGLDDEQMRRMKLSQLRIDQNTKLTDLRMQVRVSQMKLNRMRTELRNEQYLDSLGSGTTDRVRQAQLSYNVASLELEQLRKQYANECLADKAEYEAQQLDLTMFRKSLAEIKRTLDDAQIRSPRRAILTFISSSVGAQIAQGQQVATVSDLSHYKVDCEIADTYGSFVVAGGHVVVRTGGRSLQGTISSVTPLSQNGVIKFSVQLRDASSRSLRSGLKTDVYVLTSVKSGVLRISNGPFYSGPGMYKIFVQNGPDELLQRSVRLGESNYDYIEVVSGLHRGDRVVVDDMKNYKDNNKLKLNLQ